MSGLHAALHEAFPGPDNRGIRLRLAKSFRDSSFRNSAALHFRQAAFWAGWFYLDDEAAGKLYRLANILDREAVRREALGLNAS